MNLQNRLWLVRTRSGEVLGPFSQMDLTQRLLTDQFDKGDEIAPSNTPWMSTDVLLGSDDEITRTSTKNQTVSQTLPIEGNTAPQILQEIKVESTSAYFPEPKLVPPLAEPARGNRIAPFILGSLLCLGIWSMVMQSGKTPVLNHGLSEEANSTFMQSIDAMIASGESSIALDLLLRHHESPSPSDYPSYAVILSALLITQGQKTALAKKILVKILSEEHPLEVKSSARRWLGYQMLAQDEGDMGENHFLESLQLDPKDAASRFNLGRAYLKQERYAQALDYFQLAELEMPDLWLIHIYKGRARGELGQYAQAETSFKRAIELAPDRWLSHIYYALFLSSRQDGRIAQEVLHNMILRDSSFEKHAPVPWGFFQEKANYNEYLKVYSHITKGAPIAEKTLGLYIIKEAGNISSNQKTIKELARAGNGLAQLQLLRSAVAAGNTAEISSLLPALQGDIRDFRSLAYVIRGQAHAATNNISSAENDFKFALTLDPTSAIAYWSYAEFLNQINKRQESVAKLQELLNIHPNFIPAVKALSK